MYILKANKIIACLPIFWIVLFWLFVGIVTLEYGRFPSYNKPDPKDSSWSIIHDLLFIGIFAVPILMISSFVVQIIIFFFEKDQFSWKVLGFQILSILIFVLHSFVIPSRIINWFGD